MGLGVDTTYLLGHWSQWLASGGLLASRAVSRREEVHRSAKLALFGAMSVNGMAVLLTVRQAFPDIFVTETHPKVLYYALVQTALTTTAVRTHPA